MTEKETDLIVSIVNLAAEQVHLSVSEDGIGYDPKTLEINSASEDSLEDQLKNIFQRMQLDCMETKYVLIPWPDIQCLMDHPDFEAHSSLADCEQFGSSAYFVEEHWLNSLKED